MDEKRDQNIPITSQDKARSPVHNGAHTPQGAPSGRGKLGDLGPHVKELRWRLKDERYAHQAEFPDFHKLLAFPDTVPLRLVQECSRQLEVENIIVRGESGLEFFKPNDAEEEVLHEPLTTALNIICKVFSAAVPPVTPPDFDGTQHPRQYSHHYLVVGTNKPQLRDHPASLLFHPGLCLMISGSELGAAEQRTWKYVILPIEIKTTYSKEPLIQPAAQTMALLSLQDCRLFSYSMTIEYPKFTLYLWDRSGFLSSKSSDLSTEDGVRQLIQVFGRFCQMTLEDHGFDPTTFSIPETSRHQASSTTPLCHPPLKDPIYVRHNADFFRLGERITPMSGIFGKQTRCWEATKCDILQTGSNLHHNRAEFIIKESWLHDDLDGAHPSPAQPSESGSDDPFTADVVLSEEWTDVGLKVAEDKPRRLVGDDGYEVGLYRYLEEKGTVPGLAGFHGGSMLKSTFGVVRRGCGPDEMLSRTHYRVILSTVGQQLRNASSPQELLMAIRDIVDCHEGLCRRNILHRDISDTNCLMDPVTKKGFITDLDHAIDITRLKEDVARSRRHRMGTLAFMAVGLLLESVEPHHWTHDYESIFWMLLWICAGSPAFGRGDLVSDTENKKVLQIFLAHQPEHALELKIAFLYSVRTPLHSTHPYFRPLGGCISDLRSLFNRHRMEPTHPSKRPLTRKAFREVLTDWIGRLENVPFDSKAIGTLQTHDDGRFHPLMVTISQYVEKSSAPTTSKSKSSLFTSHSVRAASSRGSSKRKAEQEGGDSGGKRAKK